jgi:TPR repeat protein
MGYLVIGIPSMQFVADTGSTRITMVLSTDFDVATHHQMISTWVLHDEKVMHDALVALATGKVIVNSDEDNVNVDKYIKEAKVGNPDAAYIVACYYLKGNRDVPLALKWMKSAASQGHVKAQNAMGLFYSTGHGVPKNPKLSYRWYLKAAKQGDGDSQMSVGCCYEDGDGVEKNLKEAYLWFLRGAKNNHPGCQWMTATYLAKGLGGNVDLEEAMFWLRKAAKAEYASAEYDLGACYIQGVGVGKDFSEGIKWIKRAAEHGDEKAQKIVERMKTQKN